MATAIFARRANSARSVLLLDGATKLGAKILVSGGGRCNVTNREVSEGDFWGGRRSIIRRVLNAFTADEAAAFFRELGVPLQEEVGRQAVSSERARPGRPERAASMRRRSRRPVASRPTRPQRRAIRRRLSTRDQRRRHTEFRRRARNRWPIVTENRQRRRRDGIRASTRPHHRADDASARAVGAGRGAQGLDQSRLSGVSHDVELAVWVDGRISTRLAGALLWTHFGISGPVALNASRHYLRAEIEGRPVRLTANFCPEMTFEKLETWWTATASARPKATVLSALSGRLPAAVAAAVVQCLEIDPARQLAHLPRAERKALTGALVEWPLPVTTSRGYNFAEATAGGVVLDEIDPSTMASRICPGLFLVGEMLDVDGRIGGFNFQWAWSTANIAGRALGKTPQALRA